MLGSRLQIINACVPWLIRVQLQVPSIHYRKRGLYRVSGALPRLNMGHSTKRLFAECYTRQRKTHGELPLCRVPGTRQRKTLDKEYFAECRALGKGEHSANEHHAISGVILCRVPSRRHSAKRSFADAWSRYSAKYTYFFLYFVKVSAIFRQFILFY
jgi:hypothetical protein